MQLSHWEAQIDHSPRTITKDWLIKDAMLFRLNERDTGAYPEINRFACVRYRTNLVGSTRTRAVNDNSIIIGFYNFVRD